MRLQVTQRGNIILMNTAQFQNGKEVFAVCGKLFRTQYRQNGICTGFEKGSAFVGGKRGGPVASPDKVHFGMVQSDAEEHGSTEPGRIF